MLAALDASIELRSVDGTVRTLRWDEFFLGPKRSARRADELITAVHLPTVDGPQDYLKVGTRNAMVIAVASVALVVDRITRTVRVGLGSVGPSRCGPPRPRRSPPSTSTGTPFACPTRAPTRRSG